MARPRHHRSSREAAEALARTAPIVSRWIERLLSAHDPALTVAQYLALQAIDEGDVVGSELARRTAVSPAAVSQAPPEETLVREWSADVAVDEELVRRLIRGQFPELDLRSLRLVAEGWDNAVWLVDERWAFRFPRRAIAIPGVEREVAVVPRLSPLLPLPVPTPVFVGRPAEGYPWPFFGAEFIPGHELADVRLDPAARTRLARPLATFLRTLHGV